MGSLIDELQRRKAAARAEAEQLRGQIARLLERLAGSRSSCRVRDGRGRDHADSGSPWTGLGRLESPGPGRDRRNRVGMPRV